ncbi:MAG: LysR family transcriptional regulator [Alteromonadales bacterium]|nr:LysR family transcriptional regulator [Alteromonadales bacterium]
MSSPQSKKLLPSTSMLSAFDAAARTGSFTNAAKELALTQGAISRQINALEQQLTVKLFHRSRQNITLTEVGKAYAKEINSALSHIRSATLNLMTNPDGGILNIAILPMFGSRWLMPRLANFLEKHPQITINTVSKLSQFDFVHEDVHCAIHFGKADWSQANCTFLMAEESVAVCSPSLLKKIPNRDCSPENKHNFISSLTGQPLLHISTRPDAWQQWFASQGIETSAQQGMHFEQFSIAANAAVAGLGIALLPKFLIENELQRAELVEVCCTPLKTENAYYLVTPNDKLDYAPVQAFKEWLAQVITMR